MVGNHKSGRKPNPDGSLERSKKYTFYVKEYAQTNSNGNIVSWIEDSYFQWFKRNTAHSGRKELGPICDGKFRHGKETITGGVIVSR